MAPDEWSDPQDDTGKSTGIVDEHRDIRDVTDEHTGPEAAEVVTSQETEPHPIEEQLSAQTQTSLIAGVRAIPRRTVVIVAVCALAALVLLVGGMSYEYMGDQKAQAGRVAAARAAAARAAVEAANEKRYIAEFDSLMDARVEILKAEAGIAANTRAAQDKAQGYKSAVSARDGKIKRMDEEYATQVARVDAHNTNERSAAAYNWTYYPNYWSYPDQPTYPDETKAPSFAAETKGLRNSSDGLGRATADLLALHLDAQFDSAIGELKQAATALQADAQHDADALATAVEAGSGDSAIKLDARQISTLRSGSAVALMQQVNRFCTEFISRHRLDVRLYDVPGGRDVAQADSSMAVLGKGRRTGIQPASNGAIYTPEQGTAERVALMDAARASLNISSQFIVNRLFVGGTYAVGDIKRDDNNGSDWLVAWRRRGGHWIVMRRVALGSGAGLARQWPDVPAELVSALGAN